MKLVPLTNSEDFAIVDDCDFERVSKHSWYLNHQGYPYTSVYVPGYRGKREKLYLHRLIIGAKKGQIVDHADRNPLNAQKSNLRFATALQNVRNMGPIRKAGKSSQFKGVSLVPAKWRSQIRVNGKSILLGYFFSETEAARAYNKAAKEYFGEFAYLNPL